MIDVKWADPTPVQPVEAGRPAVSPLEEQPLKAIILEVCEKYQIPYAHMVSARRARRFAWPRQEAYFRCYSETGASLPTIGRAFGDRDHTTIMYGIEAYKLRLRAAEQAGAQA